MPSVTIKRLRRDDFNHFAPGDLIKTVQSTVASIKELEIKEHDVDVSMPVEHVEPDNFSTVQLEVLLYQHPERTDLVLKAMSDKLKEVLQKRYFDMPRHVEVNVVLVNPCHCAPFVLRMQG